MDIGYLWIPQPGDDLTLDILNTLYLKSSLSNHVLYTVIPKDQNVESGILPEDQKFSSNYVILWDSYRDLMSFEESYWMKVAVTIPTQARFNQLTRLGNGFALPFIPNQWKVEKVKDFPLYEE